MHKKWQTLLGEDELENAAIFRPVVVDEFLVMDEHLAFDVGGAILAAVDRRQHVKRALWNEAEWDNVDPVAVRKAVGLALALFGQAEVTERVDTKLLKTGKVAAGQVGERVRPVDGPPTRGASPFCRIAP